MTGSELVVAFESHAAGRCLPRISTKGSTGKKKDGQFNLPPFIHRSLSWGEHLTFLDCLTRLHQFPGKPEAWISSFKSNFCSRVAAPPAWPPQERFCPQDQPPPQEGRGQSVVKKSPRNRGLGCRCCPQRSGTSSPVARSQAGKARNSTKRVWKRGL